ncbi:MAG: zf-TFIIB domain-containing protein [Candidatus Brocadiia bacterium]
MDITKGSDHEEKWALEEEKKRREKLAAKKLEEEQKQKLNACFMHCPKCATVLKTITIEGLEIDECPQCKGIWFDVGELEMYQKMTEEKKKSFVAKVFDSLFGG